MNKFAVYLVLGLTVASLGAACGGTSKAVGAALNVGLATAVGTARVASGECFTWCDPHHVCNPRTGLCEALDECTRCRSDQRCELVNGVGVCVDLGIETPTLHESNTTPVRSPVRLDPPLDPGPLYQKPLE